MEKQIALIENICAGTINQAEKGATAMPHSR
jgi:hypothetical protein